MVDKARVLTIIVFVLAALMVAGVAIAQQEDAEAQAKAAAAELDGRVAGFLRNVEKLQKDFERENVERDRLMLQRRFVSGKEFYFMLEDYCGAADIFWSIVSHPEAAKFPIYHDAVFYLSESLFQCGFYQDAKTHFDRLAQTGKTGPYFVLSLLRLIEISIAQENYSSAEKYYARLVSESPADSDGSLGTYLIGKSYHLRGQTAKTFGVLDSIPDTGKYYPMAQYYLAALEVKQGNSQMALDRLRRVQGVFPQDPEEQDEVFALSQLAMGRLLYENNDFPRAMTHYFSVPAHSKFFPQALHESLWVVTTRNDYLLQAINEEDSSYSNVVNEYSFYSESLIREEDKEAAIPLMTNVDELQPDLDEMQEMFEQIDQGLTRLQEEAVAGYEKMVNQAPTSPLLPDTELLVSGIYSQAQDYRKSEQWYRRAQNKYTNFAVKVRNARTRLSNDQIAVEAVSAGAATEGKRLPNPGRSGLPPEVVYWLAKDAEVQKAFTLFERALEERKNIQLMRDLLGRIESELRTLESGAGFPGLKDVTRKALQLKAEASQLESTSKLVAAQLSALIVVPEEGAEEPKENAELKAGVATAQAHRPKIGDAKRKLNAIESQAQGKKRQQIAAYRAESRALAAPIAQYAEQIDRVYGEASDMTARAARSGLTRIDQRLHDYILQARLGLVDTAWRATEGSDKDVKQLQREMEEEIRKFRRQLQGNVGISSTQGADE
jgi:tetratricopeptide (TPR) repeat protein